MNSTDEIDNLRSRALSGDACALDALLESIRLAEYAALASNGTVTHAPVHYPTEREELHGELDQIYDRFWRWELPDRVKILGDPPSSESENAARIEEARAIFEMALGLAVKLTRGIRPAICPTFEPGDPLDMRRALVDLLNLVHPVLPHRSKSFGPGWPGPDTLWTDDLTRWLGMLDEGSTPEIFKANTQKTPGFRSSDWTRKRYLALMALWALHGRTYGNIQPLSVAIAFGHTDSRYHEKISHRAEEIASAARAGRGMFGLTPFEVSQCVSIVQNGPTDPESHERRILARSLHGIIFGTRDVTSMEDAGRRYQECGFRTKNSRK